MSEFTLSKKSILLYGSLLTFFISHAQDYTRPTGSVPETIDKRFSISASIGPAYAMQDFGSKNVKNSFWDFNSIDSVKLQGFAMTGFHFNINASYLLSENIGVMVLFGNSSNQFDLGGFSSTMGYPTTSVLGTFHTSEYMIGPCFSFSEWKRVKIDLNVLIGLATSTYPDLTLTVGRDTTESFVFNPGKSFAYSFGAAVRYSLTDDLDLLLGVSYTETKMSYPGMTVTFTIPGYYGTLSRPTDVTSMTIGILRPTIGLVLKLF